MSKELYSNKEFTELKKRLNDELLRRATYKWWDPLSTPKIGEDKSSPLSLPDIGKQVPVDDKTYTINNPSEGSIERTRNITHSAHGENPGGKDPTFNGSEPDTSAAHMTVEEIKNLLVGLSKIKDIPLFYGRDEIPGLAYRDPKGIIDTLEKAEKDVNNVIKVAYFEFRLDDNDNLLCIYYGNKAPNIRINANGDLIVQYEDSDGTEVIKSYKFEIIDGELIMTDTSEIGLYKEDPNGGIKDYPNPHYPTYGTLAELGVEDGVYVMPSGETDGEELESYSGVGVNNFFDDYGAKPGDGNYHPYNRAHTPQTRRDWLQYDDQRNAKKIIVIQGGVDASTYGANPRNPNPGKPYKSVPVYTGVPGTCNVACTGLCHMTCDSMCSESCQHTCFSRCGNACTASCGNVCTGCSTMCYTSCKTKCQNMTGYSCVKSGAKTVKIWTSDRTDPGNNLYSETYTCKGCQYSCQFYPNKKTECWDAGCMGKCYTSCSSSCSTSCFGGCINNIPEPGSDYRTGKGRGCSAGCTLNCIGICEATCMGECTQTCWHACKELCSDNCEWTCSSACGAGCDNGCTMGCTGCDGTCESYCKGESDMYGCTGCGTRGGCTSSCQFDCNKNCIGKGCRSLCGIDSAGACEGNCRINCTNSACTAMCSDQCSTECTTCVNTCGFQCGVCSSLCSDSCGATCNITCSQTCEHSCDLNCVHSCSEECGGCSNLCYSCVGMCIGVCSQKCEGGCSSCSNLCGWWCDSRCNQTCFSDCDSFCINTCSGSCATFLTSTAHNDRSNERDSFKLIKGE